MRRYGRTASVFEAPDTREWRGHDVVDAGGCPSIGHRRRATAGPQLSRRMERKIR
jgi:hypothetical protein